MPSFGPCSRLCLSGLRPSFPGRARALTLLAILVCCAALVVAFIGGCTRTILVSESSPLRTGPQMRGKVYTKTDDGWQLSDNEVTIPEGWYCVPPSFVEENR